MGVMGHTDNTQTSCLHGHAGSTSSHLIGDPGDGALFSSKVHTSLFLSPFVDPWALKYV